jgi:chemotaxis protein CheX
LQRELTRQLDAAVEEVFAVMLNLACHAEPADLSPPALASDIPSDAFSASVTFFGSMHGLCQLQLDPVTAQQLTANLAGLLPADISETLYTDTAGELCNMIAGTWKSAATHREAHLPPNLCHLSCPIILPGPVRIAPDAHLTIARRYHFAGRHFTITLALI